MFDFSPVQIGIVLLIALVVFGPKRLPELGRSIGRGLRELRTSMTSDDRDEAVPPAAAAVAATTEAARAPSGGDERPALDGVVVSGVEPARNPGT